MSWTKVPSSAPHRPQVVMVVVALLISAEIAKRQW
jgi:hypothetical protein